MIGVYFFLVVVVVIIIAAAQIQKKEEKEKKALESLKNSNAYQLALKIKDELKKKGHDFGEPYFGYSGVAYGFFNSWLPCNRFIHIYFSEYPNPNRGGLKSFKYELRLQTAMGKRYYGIENEKIGIFVTSDEDYQDMPEYIKIAAEVIENSGYGSCTQVK